MGLAVGKQGCTALKNSNTTTFLSSTNRSLPIDLNSLQERGDLWARQGSVIRDVQASADVAEVREPRQASKRDIAADKKLINHDETTQIGRAHV